MTDFLLELRSEEIPARMQVKAQDDLARLFATEIAKAGLVADTIETFATPRRLALIARGLPDRTQATVEERKGPRANAPDAALAGFLRSTGLTRDQLVERDGVLFAVIEKQGQPTPDVLAAAIPVIIRGFPWPKSMRWGAASLSTESLRWVRPLQGIVALFGQDVVACATDGIESGAQTVGHRFHHAGPITIGSADSYADQLRACHVIADMAERMDFIRDRARAAALAEGLVLVEDEGLVLENAGLTEWPVPLLGRFDPTFLDVPREVIQLTMRTNQKFFACVDAHGALANAFVCTANIDAIDPQAVVAGNRKVLAARLSDAKYFWEADLKIPLAVQAEKLSQIVFHEKLGTVADKVERVAKLARWLCEEGIVKPIFPERSRAASASEAEALSDSSQGLDFARLSPSSTHGNKNVLALADLAERAARLCKADLVTGMVGEFPELQGIIGGHLARAQGEDRQVADAIRDHYKPVGQGDEVPTAPVTVAVSLADKLDTIAGFFMKNMKPTGSKDPFALRRAALGILALMFDNDLRGAVIDWLAESRQNFRAQNIEDETPEPAPANTLRAELEQQAIRIYMFEVRDFFADRLKVQQREAGVRHDLIDAVFALGREDDLVRLLARVSALQAVIATSDGANLLAGYKRAANILKIAEKDGDRFDHVSNAAAGEDEDRVLAVALSQAEYDVGEAVDNERFADAMTALAKLRPAIDGFFENVMVNAPDAELQRHRLSLLSKFRTTAHLVADFSKIEG